MHKMNQLNRREVLIGAAASAVAVVVPVLPALPVPPTAAPASSAPTLLAQKSSIGWHGRWFVLDGKALDRGQSVLDMIREREAFVAKFIGDAT